MSKESKISFWDRLVHGKGTVAEPWTTAEDLWKNEDIQKEVTRHNKEVANLKKRN